VERTFDGKTFEILPQMPEAKDRHCTNIVDEERIIVAGDTEKSELKSMLFLPGAT
jgi:hypothetical protein